MSSLIASVRRTAKHRGKSVTDLHGEIDGLRKEMAGKECEVVRLNLLLDELGGAYLNLQSAYRNLVIDREAERQATTAANERTRILDGALAEAKGEIRNLQSQLTALRATVQPRDTSDPRDQVTEPIDVRQLRDATPDDYLDRTRVGWKIPAGPVIPVMPLHEAPFAMDRPPSSPTDLPGETTLTLRVTAAPTAA